MSVSQSYDLTGPVYFFGDSLTDNGNLFEATQGLVDEELLLSLAGPGGRISNGPTYAEYVASLLGLPESWNYAVAGAEAAGRQRLGDFIEEEGYSSALMVSPTDSRLDFDMNLGGQIDRFAADTSGTSLRNGTGVIWIGGNDILGISDLLDASTVRSEAVDATLLAATDLLNLGLGEVVIATLPDHRFLPAFGDLTFWEESLVRSYFEAYSDDLADGVEALQRQGRDVRLLDMGPITKAIAEDPSAFGLIAPYDLTLRSGDQSDLAQYDEDQIAFWDSVHPSAATHGILGAYKSYALEHDPISLGNGSNTVKTGSGSDLVLGLGGGDTITLGKGADLGFGGTGADNIQGGAGNDLLSGGSQNDVLDGQADRDVLDGDKGWDLLRGGGSDDVLIDGLGSDRCYGGDGADQFLFTEAELIGGTTGADNDLFAGGSGTDTLWLALSPATASQLGSALTGSNPRAALAALGIEVSSIETIKVVVDRAGLATLSNQSWYAQADLWGLV